MVQSIIIYVLIIAILYHTAKIAAINYKLSLNNNQFPILRVRPFWCPEIKFMILFFTFIFGIRYDVGTDYLTYLSAYLEKEDAGRDEFLFMLIGDICNSLNFHPCLYFAICAFIQIYFFLFAFEKERYLYPFLILFLFLEGSYFFWMNGIRQAIAMCIWLFSLKYITSKSLKKYLLFCFIAYLFHKSAVILVLLYPILYKNKDYLDNVFIQLLLFGLTFTLKNSIEPLLIRFEYIISWIQMNVGGGAYEAYSLESLIGDLDREQSGTGLAWIFKTIVWIAIILFSNKLKEYYNDYRFNMLYFFFYIGIIASYFFPPTVIILTRPFRYFYIFQPIMLSFFVYYLINRKQKSVAKYWGYMIICTFWAIFILNQMVSTNESHTWYQFYFQAVSIP